MNDVLEILGDDTVDKFNTIELKQSLVDINNLQLEIIDYELNRQEEALMDEVLGKEMLVDEIGVH